MILRTLSAGLPKRLPAEQRSQALDLQGSKEAKHKTKEKAKAEQRTEQLSHQAEKEAVELSSLGGDTPVTKLPEKERKKKNKQKPSKDANGDDLKKPLTAYMLFNNHRRPILKKEHACKSSGVEGSIVLSLPEVSKMIGDEWGKLTED